jgi:hypothetical protein
MSCYWEQPRPVASRHDPSRPYAEQYRVDGRQFAHLFQLVSPWTCGSHTEILAERTFRLLDDNMDQLLEFKAFVTCLGMTQCSGWSRGTCSEMHLRLPDMIYDLNLKVCSAAYSQDHPDAPLWGRGEEGTQEVNVQDH